MGRIAFLVFAFFALPVHAAPTVELYTIGPSEDLFEAFGHGALCVVAPEHPDGVCYNYGTADFSDPVGLVWRFLHRQAMFHVSRGRLPLMLDTYAARDRTIYRQVLPLSPEASAELAARLEDDLRPENAQYLYHHYLDNCTTRLRDHLDVVTHGAMRRGSDVSAQVTWRDVTAKGFSGAVSLLVGMEFIVGRAVDTPMTVWEAMFLPDVLRTEVERRLGAVPEIVYARGEPLPLHDVRAGRWAVLAVAAGLSLLLGFAAVMGRRTPWRALVRVTGAVFGLLGLVVYAVAVVALLPELRRNEILLVCLPTDLLLLVLPGRLLFGYLVARVSGLVAVLLGVAGGLLIQPMWGAVALVFGPLLIALIREYLWQPFRERNEACLVPRAEE